MSYQVGISLTKFYLIRYTILRLENELIHARAQLETERRILLLTRQQYDRRIQSLEDELTHLRQLVGESLQHVAGSVNVLKH